MEFWAHQEDAKRRTGRLIALYVVLVAALALAAGYAISFICEELGLVNYCSSAFDALAPFQTPVLYFAALGFLLLVGVLCLFSPASFSTGGRSVAESLDGTLVSPQTKDTGERRLLNIVEEMAIASGMPVPPVYILENEPGINAFAAGGTINDAVVGVTRGTVERLTREELQAVVAHEFSHILNGDMRLDLRFAQMLFGLMCLGEFCGIVIQGLARGSSRRGNGRDKGGGMAALMLLVAVVWLAGAIMGFVGNIIQAAVNRQREFLADASSVQFTRTTALASALKKIAALQQGSKLENTPMTASCRHLFFCSVRSGLFDTHPPLEVRIKRLEPQWDGSYPHGNEPVRENFGSALESEPGHTVESTRATKEATQAANAWEKLRSRKNVSSAAWLGQLQERFASGDFMVIPDGEPLTRPEAASLLREAARGPLEAGRMIFGLLLDDRADLQAKQLAHIKGKETKYAIRAYHEAFAALSLEENLDHIERAIPALKTFSHDQFKDFRLLLTAFINADGEFSFKEWVLQQLVVSQVGAQYTPAPRVASDSVGIAGAAALVLSALARLTPGKNNQQCAFDAGAEALGLPVNFTEVPLNPEKLSAGITVLANAPDRVKQHFMHAAACVAGYDSRVDSEEAVFLRVLSLCIGVPVPSAVMTPGRKSGFAEGGMEE